jgi:hypothetical protein
MAGPLEMSSEVAIILGAAIGALAGLLGSLIAGFFQARLERRRWAREDANRMERWRREDHARFHLYRRELYARFLSSVSRAIQGGSVVVRSASRSAIAQELPEFMEQRKQHLEAVAAVVLMWEEINLIGSPSVVDAANEINKALMNLRVRVLAATPGFEKIAGGVEDKTSEYFKTLRPRFLAAARDELGLDEPP